MEITVLCKVVDNFGDIGVIWRLCKRLIQISDSQSTKINLLVDDLNSFNKIWNKINPELNFQTAEGINIYNSNAYEYCYSEFSGKNNTRLQVILEMFQCGRPDWLEKILFEDELNHVVNVIMVDYLTAEDYAESFHCLKSLTRSSKVQKVNFMPGFTDKTGGLIIDSQWETIPEWHKEGPVLCFTYSREGCGWKPFVDAIVKNQDCCKKILLAQGKGLESMKKAFSNLNSCNFLKIEELPFINQDQWDDLMKTCSMLFIRGEESLSRACLSGIPFVWHAYPQSDEYQLVKVKALLNRMKNSFAPDLFEVVENCWISVNSPSSINTDSLMENSFDMFFKNIDNLQKSFYKFAVDLRKSGDLGINLMTFIEKNIIIK